MNTKTNLKMSRLACVGVTIISSLACIGCQVDVGGQTLPSAYYIHDDVQYFAPGPEFKLENEANQLKASRAASGLTP